MTGSQVRQGDSAPSVFRSAEEFCAWNFPMAHKLGTCPCKREKAERDRVLVIRSRHPRRMF